MAFLTNKLFIMQKFLKITNAPNTGQLIAIDGIKKLRGRCIDRSKTNES